MNDAQWIQKLIEQQGSLLDAKLDPIKEDISSIKGAIYGNGKPGLKDRVDCIEDNQKTISKKVAFIGGLAMLVVVAIVDIAKDLFKAKLF